tara:strand:+ start:618 stop:1826 length:1209 start_codon:yes stop_codon:yes gene_type:complete
MGASNLYVKPAWKIKNAYLGKGYYELDSGSTNYPTPSGQYGGVFYVQSLTLYFYGIPGSEIAGSWPNGLISGTYSSPSESVTINPPTPAAISTAAHAKYGSQTPREGTWHGTTYRPEEGHDVWVTGHGNTDWDFPYHGPAHTGPEHYNHYTTGENRAKFTDFPTTNSTSVSWTHSPTSNVTHTDDNLGTYTAATNVWTPTSSNVTLNAEDWHAKMVSAEAIVPTVINQNGLYPTDSSSAVAKYGIYDVAANTYTAGSTDKLSADGWHTEFLKAKNGLAVARAEIDRLLGQNLDQVATEPPPREEELRAEEFDQSPWVHGGVADDPLVEFPEFPVIEFAEPEPVEEEPEAPDAVVVPGLLRRATFAKDTETISSFSESTHNELTFTPRETVSPEFTDEGEPDA